MRAVWADFSFPATIPSLALIALTCVVLLLLELSRAGGPALLRRVHRTLFICAIPLTLISWSLIALRFGRLLGAL